MMSPGSRPWLRAYDPQTPPELPAPSAPDLVTLVEAASGRYARQTAFTMCLPTGMTASMDFATVGHLSDRFAAFLRHVAGIRPGDRVAVQLPNCLAYPVAAFGTFKAGAVLVNTNPLYTPSEMRHQFVDSGAVALVAFDLFAEKVAAVVAETPIRTVVLAGIAEGYSPLKRLAVRLVQRYRDRTLKPVTFPHVTFRDALSRGAARAGLDRAPRPQPDDIAVLQYTGGTTGVSKGAILTHANLVANVDQIVAMMRSRLDPGQETILTALPVYHIFAFTVNLLAFYAAGGHDILVPSPRPLSNLKPAFEQFEVTWLTGVNTLFNSLLGEPWLTPAMLQTMKASVAGGMALHHAVAERWEERTRTPIIEGYGLTEASPVVSFNPLSRPKRDSIGIPVPGTDIRLVDASGADVAEGQAGELLVRGPQVMPGYWQAPGETARVLRDGWLATGDIGTMDDEGYLRIVDRKKDLVLVSGFNVYPNEVEDCLAHLPAIAEAAVVGIPDETTGEAVCAFIVRRDPALSAEQVIAHCRTFLTNYKVPRKVIFRDVLPKSSVGKILRKDLKAEWQEPS